MAHHFTVKMQVVSTCYTWTVCVADVITTEVIEKLYIHPLEHFVAYSPMHLFPKGIDPGGHSHSHVSGLEISPKGHVTSGQAQEHVLLLNIFRYGQDNGSQQSHLPG